MKRSPIVQALIDAQRAAEKAVRELPGYEARRQAKAAVEEPWEVRERVERLLKKVRQLTDAVQAFDTAVRDAERRREIRAAAKGEDFSDEERRLILSTLHPDTNASPERREAAFKAFNAKRGGGK